MLYTIYFYLCQAVFSFKIPLLVKNAKLRLNKEKEIRKKKSKKRVGGCGGGAFGFVGGCLAEGCLDF